MGLVTWILDQPFKAAVVGLLATISATVGYIGYWVMT